MKILWLGMVASNEMFSEMSATTIGQASAHAAQNSILSGLDNNGMNVDTISAHNYPPFPAYPNKYVKEVRWNRTSISNDVCVGFWNIRYLSHFSKAKALKKAVHKWLKDNSKEDDIHIIVYSLHSPLLYAAKFAKKIDNRIHIHVIVPDLPRFVDAGANTLKRFLKRIDWVIIKLLMKSVDKYVLVTKYMADYMRLPLEKYIVIEGSVNEAEMILQNSEKTSNNNEKVIIMYAGATNKHRGIVELLEAFESIDDENYELWLAGSGYGDQYIRDRSKIDKRIKQLGFIADRKKLLN